MKCALSGAGPAPHPVTRPASGMGHRHHHNLGTVDREIVEEVRETRGAEPTKTGSEGSPLIRCRCDALDRLVDSIAEGLGDPRAPPRTNGGLSDTLARPDDERGLPYPAGPCC